MGDIVGPCETPLLDLARNVPKDLRAEWEIQWFEDGTPCGHAMAPVGKYLHDMADEIERLQNEADEYQQLQDEIIVALGSRGILPSGIVGEIERLRAALERIAMVGTSGSPYHTGGEMHDIAREALKEQPTEETP